MNEVERTVEELKTATGWPNIQYVDSSYVLTFDIKDMRRIKGLKQGKETLYLQFDTFNHLPISFVVKFDRTVHQYWTLGGQLHRPHARPAYISYDPDKDRIIRRWYWHGILHRMGGPAKEMIQGHEVKDMAGFDDYYRESWKTMQISWYREGLACSFPYPTEAIIKGGSRIRNRKTHRVESPRDDLSAASHTEVEIEWQNPKPGSMFWPKVATFADLSEWYLGGVFKSRCAMWCDITWMQGATEHKADQMTRFNEEFRDGELISAVDLWGEFYDEEGEFLLLTEFERIGKDPE